MKAWDDLVNYFHNIADQTAEQQKYNENPEGFSREKRAELRNIPQDDVNPYIKDLADQRRAFQNAEGAIGMSGGIKLLNTPVANAIRKEAGQVMTKEGIEGLRDRLNRLQEYLQINESGVSSLPEEAFKKANEVKEALQNDIAERMEMSQKLGRKP